MENPKAKPGSKSIPPNKVHLSRSRDTSVTSSRLAKMWANHNPILAVETRTRGLKRKLFDPVGGVEKAGRMDTIWSGVPVDMECSGAAGEESQDQSPAVEMISQSQTVRVLSQSQMSQGEDEQGSQEQPMDLASQGSQGKMMEVEYTATGGSPEHLG